MTQVFLLVAYLVVGEERHTVILDVFSSQQACVEIGNQRLNLPQLVEPECWAYARGERVWSLKEQNAEAK